MSKLNEEELLEKLDQWIRRARRDEAPDKIIWHIDDESAYQDIVTLIKKLEVTEEWIEEKAKYLHDKISGLNHTVCRYNCEAMVGFRNFIGSLVEEITK